MTGSTLVRSALFVAVSALAACGGKEQKTEDAAPEDARSAKPVDKKLAAALAAAETAATRPGAAPSANPDGPPETGVFPTGKADSILALNAPPKIEVIQEGADPKTALAYAPEGEQKTTLTVSVRLGPQQALPTVEFELVARVAKADKSDKKKDKKGDKKGDKKDDKAAEEPAAGGTPIVLKVASASAAKEQLGQLPKQVADAITKLSGSEIHYNLKPDGATTDMLVGLPKGADPALGDLLRAMSEVVSLVTVPLPTKPVGVGALWMVTDRASTFGIPIVRYRAFHLDKLDGKKAKLSVDIRQYAAKPEYGDGANQLNLAAFSSQGKATADFGGILAEGVDLKLDMRALMARGQQQQQQQVSMVAKSK